MFTPSPLPTSATFTTALYDPSSSPERLQSLLRHTHQQPWLTFREDTPTWSPFSSSTTLPSLWTTLLPPFFLQPAQPPTRAPLKPLEKTHLSQSVAEQDVSLGEKVSLWVSVHFSNGGCFFMRGCVSVREYLCVVRDVWGVCNNNGKKKKWRWYSMLTNHANVSSDLWNRSEMQAKWWGCKVSVFWRD